MSSQLEIYKKIQTINSDKKRLELLLSTMNDKISDLKEVCSHDLVLRFMIYKTHPIEQSCDCYCPACGKKEIIYNEYGMDNSSFKDSKIVDLKELSYNDYHDYFDDIIEFVFNNYEFCYSSDSNEDEISKKIYDYIALLGPKEYLTEEDYKRILVINNNQTRSRRK